MNDIASALPFVPENTLAWIRERCPLIVLWGDSGVGKTHQCGTLFHRAEYFPVYYIEGDDGASTVSTFTDYGPAVCAHRNYAKTRNSPTEEMYTWFMRELEAAKTAECGAIIVEGITRMYKADNAASMAEDVDLTGKRAQRVRVVNANRVEAVIGRLERLRRYRKDKGTGVPIIVTLNVTEVGKDDARYLAPGISGNKARLLMEAADLFGQLIRDSADALPRLHVLPQFERPYFKMRNQAFGEELAETLLTAGHDIPWMLERWHWHEQNSAYEQSPLIEQLIAASLAAQNKEQDQ